MSLCSAACRSQLNIVCLPAPLLLLVLVLLMLLTRCCRF
jgi:hypothetical protein